MFDNGYKMNKKIIIDNPDERCIEIYKITNTKTNKCYIGQTVSHVLNHKRYRPYGHTRRLKAHICEAFSTKENQCTSLNEAIREYGAVAFKSELIVDCPYSTTSNWREEADKLETYYMEIFNTLAPNGYNLKNGGQSFVMDDEYKKRVSEGVLKSIADKENNVVKPTIADKSSKKTRKDYSEDFKNKVSKGVIEFALQKKLEKFKNVININDNIENHIRTRGNSIIVNIDGYETSFGGIKRTIEEKRKDALEFIKLLKKNLAKHLDAGNPLEL